MTLRELLHRKRGHDLDRWNHTATIVATLANIHRDVENFPDPLPPTDFHPLLQPDDDEEPDTDTVSLSTLAALF